MKHPALFLAMFAALAFSNAMSAAQPARTVSANDPATAIRSFYHWYVTALIANRDPMKNRVEMKRFVTDRLYNEIDKMVKGPEGLDGDYFVDAQDFDDKWAKNIAISNVKISAAKATADVVLTGSEKMMTKRLRLNLVNDGGAWKIDKVQGRE